MRLLLLAAMSKIHVDDFLRALTDWDTSRYVCFLGPFKKGSQESADGTLFLDRGVALPTGSSASNGAHGMPSRSWALKPLGDALVPLLGVGVGIGVGAAVRRLRNRVRARSPPGTR